MFLDEEVRRLERAAADGDDEAARRLERVRERVRSWATIEVSKLLSTANAGREVAALSLEDDLRPIFEAVVQDGRRWGLAVSKMARGGFGERRTIALLARHEHGGCVLGARSVSTEHFSDVWPEFTVPLMRICRWQFRGSDKLGAVLIDTLPDGDANEIAMRDPVHYFTNGVSDDRIRLGAEDALSVLQDMPSTVLTAVDREAVSRTIRDAATSVIGLAAGLDEAISVAKGRAVQRVVAMGYDAGNVAAKREEALKHVDLWVPSLVAAMRS